jgi:hypothetical protein
MRIVMRKRMRMTAKMTMKTTAARFVPARCSIRLAAGAT